MLVEQSTGLTKLLRNFIVFHLLTDIFLRQTADFFTKGSISQYGKMMARQKLAWGSFHLCQRAFLCCRQSFYLILTLARAGAISTFFNIADCNWRTPIKIPRLATRTSMFFKSTRDISRNPRIERMIVRFYDVQKPRSA